MLDGKRIVSRAMLEMMTSDQLGPDIRARTTSTILDEGYTFGLGFAIRQETGQSSIAGSKGDYTWGGAYGTYFWVDPKEELVAVFMSAAPGEIRVHYRSCSAASSCRPSRTRVISPVRCSDATGFASGMAK